MLYQLPVTVRANVSPERLDDLRDLLTEVNKNGPANPVLPFDRPGWSRREPTPDPARAHLYPNNRLCGLGEVAERCAPDDQ